MTVPSPIDTEGDHPLVSNVRHARRLTDAERTELLEALLEDTDGVEDTPEDGIGTRQLVEQAAETSSE